MPADVTPLHLDLLPAGCWAVLDADGAPHADVEGVLAPADLPAGGLVSWDGQVLTICTPAGDAQAHLLTGRRAMLAAVLAASAQEYDLEHPHVRALWHHPDVVQMAIEVFDHSPAIQDEAQGCLEVVIERLEEVPPAAQPALARLCRGWSSTLEDLVLSATTVVSEPA